MAQHQDAESVPLLDEHAHNGRISSLPTDEPGRNASPPPLIIKARRWQTRSPWAIVALAAVCKFTITLCGTMFMLPFFRILEDGFCHRYYGDWSPGFLDEKKCKERDIQRALAYFIGWFGLVNAVFGQLHSSRHWRWCELTSF
jgi:hypothetical protein